MKFLEKLIAEWVLNETLVLLSWCFKKDKPTLCLLGPNLHYILVSPTHISVWLTELGQNASASIELDSILYQVIQPWVGANTKLCDHPFIDIP